MSSLTPPLPCDKLTRLRRHLSKLTEFVSPGQMRGAIRAEEAYAGELNKEAWPLVEEDGDSLAFFHMMSEGKVSLL